MQISIKYLLWLPILGFLISCKHTCDDEMKPPEPPVECTFDINFPLEMVWSSLLRPDSSGGGSMSPMIYENDILFNNGRTSIINTIYSLSPEDGSHQWEWGQFLEPPGDFVNLKSANISQAYDNKFYFDHGQHKMLLDVENQNLIWATDAGFSEKEQVRIGDYLYYVGFISSGGVIQGSQLFRLHKDSTIDNWELVYELQGGHIFGAPALWINPAGNKILLFKSTVLDPLSNHLIGYNLDNQEQEFIIEDVSAYFNRQFVPIILDNKAYLPLSGGITCVDLLTKNVLWETQGIGDTYFIQTNPVVHNGTIVIHAHSKQIVALSAETGDIQWQHENTGGAPPNMVYYQGALYYGGSEDFKGYLYGVDFDTGEQFLKTESPFVQCTGDATFYRFISIDQLSGRLYTTDGIWAYCFQLEPR